MFLKKIGSKTQKPKNLRSPFCRADNSTCIPLFVCNSIHKCGFERLPNIYRISAKNRVNMTSQNWLYLTNYPTDFVFFAWEDVKLLAAKLWKVLWHKIDKKCKELWETSRVAQIPAVAPLCSGARVNRRHPENTLLDMPQGEGPPSPWVRPCSACARQSAVQWDSSPPPPPSVVSPPASSSCH